MNILLVEDDLHCRENLLIFLKSLGHTIFESENGKSATEVLSNEEVNLVLTDVKMPVMNGYELLKWIRQQPKMEEIIVVLITGHGDMKNAIESMKNGAYDYLQKPVNLDELICLIQNIDEYVSLKEEHRLLKRNFKVQVDKATREMKQELSNLKKAFVRELGIDNIGVFSDKLAETFEIAERLHNNNDIPVLIEGETGTGKEVIARYIHYGKGDVATPFIGLNCAAISPQLFESELFGYVPGAFTGGNPKGQIGKIALAENGTLFLDEITELSPNFQAKILRLIQEREYYPVGGTKKHPVNVRIICTTNQDVKESLKNKSFREDLYFRLCTGHIKVPPLRERPKEIIPLANMFLQYLRKHKKTGFEGISKEAVKILEDYFWPGNVRELKNIIEGVILHFNDSLIKPEYLSFIYDDKSIEEKYGNSISRKPEDISLPGDNFDLNEWTLEIVKKAFDMHDGNKTNTAKYLGISRSMLYTYLNHIENL